MSLPVRIAAVVGAGFTFSVLAVWADLRIPASRYVVRPGVVITVSWLGIDFWRYPGIAFCLSVAFNTAIYSGLLFICLALVRVFTTRCDP